MYTFESRVRYSETDSGGKLTMASLINYFQDCSTFQSEELGVGVEYLRERSLVWVLSAWQIVVERYPSLCEKITACTLPYDMKGFLGYRNFCLLDGEGRYLARANSLWSLLDTETGKPRAVSEYMMEKYRLEPRLDMEYAPRKIKIPENGAAGEPVLIRPHHLDLNHHVNNQQFIDIAMDYLPQGFVIGQVRAEYKKQAFLDDLLTPYVASDGEKRIVALTDGMGGTYAAVEFTCMEEK